MLIYIKKLLYPAAKLYWKTFKPKTYGVKAVVVRKLEPNSMLLIRQSYGNTKRWNIPGGGYKPIFESKEKAIVREIKEEIGCKPISCTYIGEFYSESQGKKDNVSIFTAVIEGIGKKNDGEVSEIKWASLTSVQDEDDVASIVKYAANMHVEMAKTRQ